MYIDSTDNRICENYTNLMKLLSLTEYIKTQATQGPDVFGLLAGHNQRFNAHTATCTVVLYVYLPENRKSYCEGRMKTDYKNCQSSR